MVDFLEKVSGPRKRRAVMEAAGVTNVMIAELEGVTPEYVSYVINDKRTGYRIRRRIAIECKVAVEYLWPDTPPEQLLAA